MNMRRIRPTYDFAFMGRSESSSSLCYLLRRPTLRSSPHSSSMCRCLARHAETNRRATPPPRPRLRTQEGGRVSILRTREGRQLSFRRVCCSAPICHSLRALLRASEVANERDLCHPSVRLSFVRSFAPKPQNGSNLPDSTPSAMNAIHPNPFIFQTTERPARR